MATIFPDKRTRSQLTLPEFDLHLDRSPMKDARTRLQAEAPSSTMPDAAESYDELLLSPSPSKKRAASPLLANEYASAASSSDFPAAKRLRTEGGDIEGDHENTVGPLLKSSPDARLATEGLLQGTPSPDKHSIAQSVPAFPMLDLRNPPRKRQWSRAPDRPLPVFAYKRIPLPTIQEPAVSPPRLPVEGKPVSDSKKSFKAGASRKKLAIPHLSRGSLKKKEQQAEKAGQAPRSKLARKALISAVQASPKKADLGEELSPLSDSGESGDAPVASTSTLRAPQTPAKLPSFAKATQSSLAKTPGALRSPVKASFGSPFKLARSTTLATRPANTYASRTEANSLLNQYYRKADELNSSMMSHKPVVLRPPGVPRSVPALQRSVTHESVLCNKAGPSAARSNDANHVGKRMLTGRGKPVFPNKATCKASQKTPLAAVPGSPVRGDTEVIDLTEDDSFESDNRARLVLLRARTKDDDLKEILDNTLNRKEALPVEEEPMMRVSTAEAFDNLRQAAQAMATPATPPRTGLRSASSTIPSSAPVPNLEPYTRPHSALATLRPAEGDAEEIPGDDEDVDDGDFIDDKNYHGASKKRKGGLTVLSHVRAFVDVRDAHTSRDSGEAFVEFLETLGAKVLKKLTKTCTHIVFRNGSFNTVSKWKAAETKPLVVRISWLMECVDKKEHVAEDEHLLDISDLFPSGVDPKIRVRSSRLGHSDGADESCETSMDSSSQPLEMARRRC